MLTTSPALPQELDSFLKLGKKKFRCDDGDWQVEVKSIENSYLTKALPGGSLVIANNGCGDYLYIIPTETGEWETGVNVFWHEGQRKEVFANSLTKLTNPPPSTVSSYGPVIYSDGTTEVRLGDEVSVRYLVFFRSTGRVNYVPGISKKNRNMEFNGLTWVGIKFPGGSKTGILVDDKTFRLQKRVQLLKRSEAAVEELKPEDDLE